MSCVRCVLVPYVAGSDPFDAALDALNGNLVGRRPVVVKRYAASGPLAQCRVLFVSDSEKRRLDQIFAATSNVPALLVGELENFIQLRGVIRLVTTDRGIQFEVNADAVRRHGLKLSGRLMQPAGNVIGEI